MGRKCLVVFMVILLMLSLSLTCFGAKEYTITIHSMTDGHRYEAYQIFTGTPTGAGDLTATQWGDGVDSDGLLAALRETEDFANCTTVRDVADVLRGYGDDSERLQEFASLCEPYLTVGRDFTYAGVNDYVISLPAAGYYLIKDRDDSLTGADDSYTRLILELSENQVIYAKMGIPTLEKTVWNEDKEGGADWDDHAHGEIGQSFTFRGVGTLPENLKDYDSYQYVITDRLPEGLTYIPDSVRVTLNGEEGSDLSQWFTVSQEDGVLTVSCPDLYEIPELKETDKIVLIYRASLNKDAIIGNPGNINAMDLTFSNDPNWDGEGQEPTGTTVPHSAVVFTYALDVHKIDMGTRLPVGGAEFLLYGENGSYLRLGAEGELLWGTEAEATILATDDSGLITVKGLAPGTYYLKEIKAPNGYNMLAEPVKIEISVQYTVNTEGLTEVSDLMVRVDEGELSHSSTVGKSSVDVEIENAYGTTLPSTGGMGTAMYYMLGVAVLFATALIFVAKWRLREQ